MPEDVIWVVTNEEPQPTIPEGDRGGGIAKNPLDSVRTIAPLARPGMPVRVEQLEQGMTDFLRVMGRVISHAKQRAGELAGMELDEIELSVEVNGEGQLSLLGSGGKMGGKGAMMLRFKAVSQGN
jgi:hypothetical protein